jgi:NADH-quinone oxidoreductase subunit N
MQHIRLLLPELFVLSMACLTLLVDVYQRGRSHRAAYWLAQATLVGALAITTLMVGGDRVIALHGTFVNDPMGMWLKSFIYAIVILAFVYSRDYLDERDQASGEFFVIGLFAVLGMMVLCSAHSFLTLYLGLELLSLSLYSMVAINRHLASASEAAMKYFVLGALASGMLLYGISILYGVTGTLDLAEFSRAAGAGEHGLLLVFGLVFVIVGIGFKLGTVPFHMWLPDVYHGASTAATLFIASAPKIAAYALAVRLLVDGLGPLTPQWQDMVMVLAVLSIAIGNVVAIAQSNIKRMLAYSTIAHMGFLLLGIISGSFDGYASSMFYAVVYALMSAGAFGVIILLGRAGFEADMLDDFKGLNGRSAWFALIMLILMFSMAGVPPFAGFWGKWFVIKEIVAAGEIWLAVFAVLFSVIGAFYYLRVVKLMFFDEAEAAGAPGASGDMRLALSFNGLAVLALGIFPGLLMKLCLVAMQ